MEKIDVVYTWVNGEDLVWRKKRETALRSFKNIEEIEFHGNVEGRFRDNGELRYSLRSLEKYFPEHGDIYIVTDDQIPEFLKQDDRLKIVFQKDFMKEGTFPSFSSKNIISQIPNIADISERFLVFNDDVFLWPDFDITDFFEEVPKFYFVEYEASAIHPQIVSGSSGENILASKYSDYKVSKSYVAHTPKAVIKKDFFEMREEFSDICDTVSHEVFRDIKNPGIIGDLYSRWMLYKKRGTLGLKKDFYIQSSSPNYEELCKNFENIAFFCINDTGDNAEKSDESLQKISEVLEKLFPEPSCFEK